ncbi:hypothetical protein TNCV_2310151 [Trichonephila clavipes]|nr:hypothetical protein TNCV_2310151 [Trichonephila clavipes]
MPKNISGKVPYRFVTDHIRPYCAKTILVKARWSNPNGGQIKKILLFIWWTGKVSLPSGIVDSDADYCAVDPGFQSRRRY